MGKLRLEGILRTPLGPAIGIRRGPAIGLRALAVVGGCTHGLDAAEEDETGDTGGSGQSGQLQRGQLVQLPVGGRLRILVGDTRQVKDHIEIVIIEGLDLVYQVPLRVLRRHCLDTFR